MHKTFDVKIDPKLTQAQIAAKINAFLHENSSVTEKVDVEVHEDGSKHAVFRIQIDEKNAFEVKRNVEGLYDGLTPERHLDTSKEEVKQHIVKEMKNKEN